MNNREQRLAVFLGAILVLFALFWIGTRWNDQIVAKQNRIGALQKELQTHRTQVTRAKRATQKLQSLETRSLPADIDKARSVYQSWLLALVDRIGVTAPQIKSLTGRNTRANTYQTLAFTIEGETTLEQATSLLYEFYSSADLHRIDSLSLKPIANSKRLKLDLNIEALLLPGSKRQTIGELKSERLGDRSREHFVGTITSRNLFSPANQPPTIEAIKSQTVDVGQTLNVKPVAADPDTGDELQYELVGTIPDGLAIDAKTGALRWKPSEAGEHDVTVKVSDDGFPALTDQKTFRIVAEVPPAETPAPEKKPSFDDAPHAVLVATTRVGDRSEAWIKVRTKGKMLRLASGEEVSIGSFRGSVRRVDPATNRAWLANGEKIYVVRVGDSLGDAQPDNSDEQIGDAKEPQGDSRSRS